MRALSMSYGDIWSFTRSPLVRRMKRLRIFPEMCASTVCSFGSCTRNMVPARTEVILPSTSIDFFSELIRVAMCRKLEALPSRGVALEMEEPSGSSFVRREP